MEAWQNFFLAQVGASAALAGLIFVAVSISLSEILASKHLPNRALRALVILVQILIVSSLILVPQSIHAVGIEVIAIGVASWLLTLLFDIQTMRAAGRQYFLRAAWRAILSQIAAMLYIAAGYALLSFGDQGLYWLVPTLFCSYMIALLDAWVLLIEIHR